MRFETSSAKPKAFLPTLCWLILKIVYGAASTRFAPPINGYKCTERNALKETIAATLKKQGGSASVQEIVNTLKPKQDHILSDWLFWEFYPVLREMVVKNRVTVTRENTGEATLHLK